MNESVSFKIKKVLRYIELYGLSRTFEKVRGQFHMKAIDDLQGDVWVNTKSRDPDGGRRAVAIVGCGSFAYSNIAFYLNKMPGAVLKAAMDVSGPRAKSLAARYGAAYATTQLTAVLSDPAIKLVYIASNHATHAPYAIEALDAGKDVHIEKPHVVDPAQLAALLEGMARNPERKVYLGFNRPRSQHFRRLIEEVGKESGPAMINWFIAGHEIPDGHWYFDEAEGGRILGNLCHWSDMTLAIVGLERAFPCRIVPVSRVGSKSDFITSIEFADGSLATLTFSAKGHTFEGVREVLNVHKGDLLAELKDFKSVSIVRGPSRKVYSSRHRDHGHGENIVNSYLGTFADESGRAVDPQWLAATAELFLKIREAHDRQREVVIEVVPRALHPTNSAENA